MSEACGDSSKMTALFNEVYRELRALARRQMAGEREDHTLQPTALVHEAYLRLQNAPGPQLESRGQFFKAAAEAMRRILIDHARAKGRSKRGGGTVKRSAVELDHLPDPETDPVEILAFDEAICRLEQHTPDIAAVVRLRFYGGLSVEETAEALSVSPRTVIRSWVYAKAWLYRELEGNDAGHAE